MKPVKDPPARSIGLGVEVGQVWQNRQYPSHRLEIRRLARRSVFGSMTISGIDLTANAQVLYSALRAKWERVPPSETPA